MSGRENYSNIRIQRTDKGPQSFLRRPAQEHRELIPKHHHPPLEDRPPPSRTKRARGLNPKVRAAAGIGILLVVVCVVAVSIVFFAFLPRLIDTSDMLDIVIDNVTDLQQRVDDLDISIVIIGPTKKDINAKAVGPPMLTLPPGYTVYHTANAFYMDGVPLSLFHLYDTSVGAAVAGNVLGYDGSNWVPVTGTTMSQLGDIGDVTLTSLVANQLIAYNGANWVNTLVKINNVDTLEIQARVMGVCGSPGEYMKSIDASGGVTCSSTVAIHTHIASDIVGGTFADARISSSSVLQYNSILDHNALLNYDVAQHRTINDAGTSLTELWSASKINTELASKAALAHTHDAADVISGTFADVRISVSSVTQHEGSIDHNALLNYDINEHRTINDAGTSLTSLWSSDKISTELAGKANTIHTHVAADVTDFSTAVDARITLQKAAPLGLATLDGGGKVPASQLPSSLQYQGVWDASTNTPTLTSGVGTNGYFYIVNVAGTTTLDGISSWAIRDWAVFDGTAWQKVDNTESVTSVAGKMGAVTLNPADIVSPGTFADSLISASSVTQHESLIDHDALLNYNVAQHRIINDAGTSLTELWSASKISTELSGKANTIHTHAASDIVSGTFADARISASSVAQHEGSIDHNALLNYDIDEHRTINDAGTSLTSLWSSSKINTELSGKANTVHTHDASAIVSGQLADARISSSSVVQHEGLIDHNALLNYVANRHIDHSAVTIAVSGGLTIGGGTIPLDITSSRTLGVDTSVIQSRVTGTCAVGSAMRIINSAGAVTCQTVNTMVIEDEGITVGGGPHTTINCVGAGIICTDAGSGVLTMTVAGGAGGESNTGSNVNIAGVGVFKQKTGVDLEFRGVNAGSSKISVTLDGPNNEIDLDVVEANVQHDNLGGFVANEHVDHSAVTLGVSGGITIGGGTSPLDITASRTIGRDATVIQSRITGTCPVGSAMRIIDQAGTTPTCQTVNTIITQDEGVTVTGGPHTTLNFVGAGVTATNAGSGVTTVTIPGGGSDIASNVNVGGVGVFKQKTGSNFEFRGVNAASSKISVTLDTPNNEVDVDVVEANVNHNALLNYVANRHIDHSAVTLGVSGGITIGGGTSPLDITTSRTIGRDATVIQSRVSGTCPVGSAMRIIDQAGTTPTCQTVNTIITQDEGVTVTGGPHTTLNFVGAGVTATNAGSGVTTVTIPGGGASTITNIEVTATADYTGAGATYGLITTMTNTPAAGTYWVSFSSSCQLSATGNLAQYAIFVGGTIVAHSERNAYENGGGQVNGVNTAMHTQAVITPNGSQAVEIRALTAGGTLTIHERSMFLIKLA